MAVTVNVIYNLNAAQGDDQGTINVDAAGDLIVSARGDGANGEGAVLEIAATPTGFADSATVLGSFPADSNGVSGSMTMDAEGNLFAMDENGELWEVPATADGGYGALSPVLATGITDPAKLTVDSNGDLFSIGADSDGNAGAFELVNTANGYEPIELASIPSGVGGIRGNPTMDAQGNLFITAAGGVSPGESGVVLELSPQAGTATGYASTMTTVAAFDNGVAPNTKVVVDANGDLFGSAPDSAGNETVYEIAKSNGVYSSTPTVLATLDGYSSGVEDGILVDANNDIFMSVTDANNNDAAVELVNTPNGYVTKTLATFGSNSAAGEDLGVLSFDAQGDVIGSTFDGGANDEGTVFEISNSQLYAAPTIAGTVAGQATTSEGPINPFSQVTIADPNDNGVGVDTLTITVTGGGDLTDAAGFSGLTSAGAGVYTLSGSAASITSELDGLAFTPAAGAPGSSTTSGLALSYQSSVYAAPVVDATTSVVDSDPAPLDPPTISDPSSVNGVVNASANSSSQALSGSALPGSTVSIYLNGASAPAYSVTADASGTWSQTIGALNDGAYSFTATTTDASGKVSALSTPSAFVVATQGPTVSSFSESVSGPTSQTSDTLSLSASAEALGGDQVSSVAIYDNSTFVADAIENASGAWTYTATGLVAGDHNFSAVVTDSFGNATSTSALPTVDVVTQAPTVAITSAGGFVSQAQTIKVSASAAAGDSVTGVSIYDGSTLLGQATQASDGSWSAKVTLPVGVDAITAVATDAAGNVATSAPVTYLATPAGDALITAKAWSLVAFGDKPTAVDATAGHVAVVGGNGANLVYGGSNDAIGLGNGSNTVIGGSNEAIVLGKGANTVSVGSNVIIGAGDGANTITAGSNAAIALGNGNDSVTAGANSKIALGNGNDTVNAGANSTTSVGTGHNTLVAASGDTWSLAANGYDTFQFDPGFGANKIAGFNTSHDVVEFSKSLFTNFSQVQGDMKQVGANTVITYDKTDVITLDNVTASHLTAADFKFV